MACACKMREHAPIGSAIRRGDAVLAGTELVDMRLRKGAKPLGVCL